MSKEYVRRLVSAKFMEFPGLDSANKKLPNQPKHVDSTPGTMNASLEVAFMFSEIESIGDNPCVRRTGVISIEVTEELDEGTRKIYELTDAIEDWFGLWTAVNFWTGAANTITLGEDKSRTRYVATVHIPFTYDQP